MQQALSFPEYHRGERIADRCIHGIGLSVGPIAVLALIATAASRDDARSMVGVTLYGCGLMAMLACSALYNLAPPSRSKALFRRLDHAAIFFMIAATYSPFTLGRIGGVWGVSLFVFVWLVAGGGMAMKLLYTGRFEGFAIALYLALGWTILVALGPLLSAVSTAGVKLLMIGGLLYTIGVPFHLYDRLPYHNAVWHALVLAAAVCHYIAVLHEVG